MQCRLNFGNRGGCRGNHRRVLPIHVAEEVGKVRLITCVLGWLSHVARLTPASGRARAIMQTSANGCGRRWESFRRSRRRGQQTWERTEWPSTKTLQTGMDVKHCEWRRLHFTLSRCGVPTLEMCGWCAAVFAREKCACVRVRWGGSVYSIQVLQQSTRIPISFQFLSCHHAKRDATWHGTPIWKQASHWLFCQQPSDSASRSEWYRLLLYGYYFMEKNFGAILCWVCLWIYVNKWQNCESKQPTKGEEHRRHFAWASSWNPVEDGSPAGFHRGRQKSHGGTSRLWRSPIRKSPVWSAWDRPGGQTPRRSCGSALDPCFRIGNSSARKVQTGTKCRSDRAGTARTADETWEWRGWDGEIWHAHCKHLEPCVYTMSVRHARKMCQKNVRATRSVCTLSVAHTVVATTWVRNPETKKIRRLRRSTSILISSTKTLSTNLLSTDHHQWMLLGFPRHALLLIFDEAIVLNLNLKFGLPRSTISNCERDI